MNSIRPFAPLGMFPSPFFGAGTATSPSVGVVGRFFPSGMFLTDFFTPSFFLQDGSESPAGPSQAGSLVTPIAVTRTIVRGLRIAKVSVS